MGADSSTRPPAGVRGRARAGEVAGGGEFVAQVVERIRFAVGIGGKGGAGGGDQIVVLTAGDRQEGVEMVDLVAELGDNGEGLGDGSTWRGSPPGTGDGVRPE